MILTSENRVLTVGGKAMERKLSGFSITVDDKGFPFSNAAVGQQSGFGVASQRPIRMKIIAGADVLEFESNVAFGGNYRISITNNGLYLGGFDNSNNPAVYPSVVFSSQSSGTRIITFVFEDYTAITELFWARFNVHGAFPNEIISAVKLQSLTIRETYYITSFPRDLSALTQLRKLNLANIGIRYDKIPDSFFDLNLTQFVGNGCFDCSDPIASNLFKISFWQNLEELELNGCMINDYFPDDLIPNPEKIRKIRMRDNNWTGFPERLSQFKNLSSQLSWGKFLDDTEVGFFDMGQLEKLLGLEVQGRVSVANLKDVWANLYSLNNLIGFSGWTTAMNNPNSFVDSLYELVTTRGSITPNGSPAPYRNRFRNIAWGHVNFRFTGAKTAPSGYVQGSSNGNPVTSGQKVYVLQNQYGHTITHGTPII